MAMIQIDNLGLKEYGVKYQNTGVVNQLDPAGIIRACVEERTNVSKETGELFTSVSLVLYKKSGCNFLPLVEDSGLKVGDTVDLNSIMLYEQERGGVKRTAASGTALPVDVNAL